MELQLQKEENYLISGIIAFPPGEIEEIRAIGQSTIEEIQKIGEVTFQKCNPQSWSKIHFSVNLTEKAQEKINWILHKLEICNEPYFSSSRRKTEETKKYLQALTPKEPTHLTESTTEKSTIETTKELLKKKKDELQEKCQLLGIAFHNKHTKMELAEAIALGKELK